MHKAVKKTMRADMMGIAELIEKGIIAPHDVEGVVLKGSSFIHPVGQHKNCKVRATPFGDGCAVSYDGKSYKTVIKNFFKNVQEGVSIDWSLVDVDDVVVELNSGNRFHFCHYEDRIVFVFVAGTSSKTCPKTATGAPAVFPIRDDFAGLVVGGEVVKNTVCDQEGSPDTSKVQTELPLPHKSKKRVGVHKMHALPGAGTFVYIKDPRRGAKDEATYKALVVQFESSGKKALLYGSRYFGTPGALCRHIYGYKVKNGWDYISWKSSD